jgi:2-polyprenyl-3-methyl-5-hydroxy-6-metoxy-1,4-benzoquinol methylase
MHTDNRDDARTETLNEILESRKLYNDTPALRKYWDDLFSKHYMDILESKSEIGRHGIIAEIINRFATEGKVLDVGCGTGILSQLLNYSKFSYLGCDISDAAIQFSLKNRINSRIAFKRCRIEDIGLTDELSAIVFNESLYYLDFDSVFHQSTKLINSSGLFIVSIFDYPENLALLESVRSKLIVLSETVVINQHAGFKWNIIAGHINKKTYM